jgi:hypothetical protein
LKSSGARDNVNIVALVMGRFLTREIG